MLPPITLGRLRALLAEYPDDMLVVGVYDDGTASGVISGILSPSRVYDEGNDYWLSLRDAPGLVEGGQLAVSLRVEQG